ncbi:MAG TPA: PDDEXK nuclease domain-containing protein, partial [Saprospiraceae bacterium]|nr:PDDEXK nuclease domain-containing protein [Saprospiraceae bacterium]
RRLRCLVAIDLKTDEFEPEHKGKMEFYLNVLNDTVKLPDENDSVGIIICKSKNRTVVEYALKTGSHPLGVASYTITNQLPEAFARFLPSEAEIFEHLWVLKEG